MKEKDAIAAALRAPFDMDDISIVQISRSKDRKRAMVAAYVDNRAVMDRLDEVVGIANWKNVFRRGPDGGVLCGISIRFRTLREIDANTSGEWVTKYDGAPNTDVESVKGGISSAMRRAANQWGIGRYLYSIPFQWVLLDQRGNIANPDKVKKAFFEQSLAMSEDELNSNGNGNGSPTGDYAHDRRQESDDLLIEISTLLQKAGFRGSRAHMKVIETVRIETLPIGTATKDDLAYVLQTLEFVRKKLEARSMPDFFRWVIEEKMPFTKPGDVKNAVRMFAKVVDKTPA